MEKRIYLGLVVVVVCTLFSAPIYAQQTGQGKMMGGGKGMMMCPMIS